MNTTQTEALKLALEALEANQPVNYCMNNNGEKFPMMQEDPFRFERNSKAITAIKEALAQTERHELQKDGKHPAPCARFCEANAFQIEIRSLKAQLAQPELAAKAREVGIKE